ncbi:hypothetical protein RHMOL_Rhmol08G0090900 [Rhododendron molle]|uniref:Uncharacterized protein n=1 Tax=Rhododendron molle TaxID=49168 RepID=A0ACC0MMK6_RHOML|nr:hypothetical protein RHMOL_Rhmol08G0090900 [Rhododendron molle]
MGGEAYVALMAKAIFPAKFSHKNGPLLAGGLAWRWETEKWHGANIEGLAGGMAGRWRCSYPPHFCGAPHGDAPRPHE